MPTIEYELEDLESILGTFLPREKEKMDDIFSYVKGEIKYLDSKQIRIELKDSNRVDIWGVEGLARALKGFLDLEKGLKEYRIEGASGVQVNVDPRLRQIRPYIGCSVVKDVNLTDASIRQLIHFQEKIDQTYGRNRRKTSIGLYEFDLITPPLNYSVAKPGDFSFVPLDFEEEMTLGEILQKHPKGIEYGNIIRNHPNWPVFFDRENKVLSSPPIINSNILGRITSDTRNVLVEVTGSSRDAVLNTLTNITLSLADRGGKVYSVKINYDYEDRKEEITPNLYHRTLDVSLKYVKEVIGIDLDVAQIEFLLEKARYGIITMNRSRIEVRVPCYRVDVIHPIDIIEDIAIAYNYNNIQPRWPKIITIGELSPVTITRDNIRELMIGFGCQETLTYVVTNPDTLFRKMNLNPEKTIQIANPKMDSMTCLRSWLLPSLIEFLSYNTHVEFPQRIFEVGYCVTANNEQENKSIDTEKLAYVTSHSNANFTEIKSLLDSLLSNLGIRYETLEAVHSSFINGRTGIVSIDKTEYGVIGEIDPKVLENWGLENPTAAFEISLEKICKH